MSLFYLKAWLQPQQEVLQICRSQLLKTMSKSAIYFEHLVALNEQVLLLRQQRTSAEISLQTATASLNPYAIAAAEARYQFVLSEQAALRSQQIGIEKSIDTLLTVGKMQTESRIRLDQLQTKEHYKANYKLQTEISNTPKPNMELKRNTDPKGGPPTFEFDDNFTERQSLHVSWIHQLDQQNTKDQAWIQPSIGLKKQDGCSASLKKTLSGLIAVLSSDKFSLNSYL